MFPSTIRLDKFLFSCWAKKRAIFGSFYIFVYVLKSVHLNEPKADEKKKMEFGRAATWPILLSKPHSPNSVSQFQATDHKP